VPDKEEYEIPTDILLEERAKNAGDSSMDDEYLRCRTSKKTYRAQRTRTNDRDDKKLFLYHASAEDKNSAPSDTVSGQKVKTEGLAQRAIGSEDNGNQILAHITEPLSMNEREHCSFSVALRSGTAEYAPLRNIFPDRNYRKFNAQDNVQGSTNKDDVPGNAKEDVMRC
jgi:hypothetical protein